MTNVLQRERKFQSTRPHGARPRHTASARFAGEFQSTRPHGARLAQGGVHPARRDFNPRALTGRDSASAGVHKLQRHFNPRALTGRDLRIGDAVNSGDDFNPRALTGRDLAEAVLEIVARDISIHAPSRGATYGRSGQTLAYPISIHAPSRGATSPAPFRRQQRRNFNPRALTGRDRAAFLPLFRCVYFNPRALTGRDDAVDVRFLTHRISIHAPSRGATKKLRRFGRTNGFQSTRPHGARPGIALTVTNEMEFQSTRPHGARPHGKRGAEPPHYFNPRALTGRDRMTFSTIVAGSNFNPRALTGRDRQRSNRQQRTRYFNPRALTGRDDDAKDVALCTAISIHAPSRGATSRQFDGRMSR